MTEDTNWAMYGASYLLTSVLIKTSDWRSKRS